MQIEATVVGQWQVGHTQDGRTLLRFVFTDAPERVFAIPDDEAEKIAEAILDQARQRGAKTN